MRLVYNNGSYSLTELSADDLRGFVTVIESARLSERRRFWRTKCEIKDALPNYDGVRGMWIWDFCDNYVDKRVSVRALTVIRGMGCEKVGDLLQFRPVDIAHQRNAGRMTVEEVIKGLEKIGIEWRR